MGKNYNFRIDQKPLDSNKIQAHQDFDALLQAFNEQEADPQKKTILSTVTNGASNPANKNRLRNNLVWGGLMAVAASLALLFIINPFQVPVDAAEWTAVEQDYFEQQAFVEAPIPAAAPEFQEQKVEAAAGGQYELNNGLKMVVPEFAFMDDYGKQIEGEVNLQYREMHDPVDFFLSGIPMHYDSAGMRYQLESAGMIEVYGFKNGKAVQLAPGKSIRIELVSGVKFLKDSEIPQFNVYYLDTMARSWKYTDTDLAQWLEIEKEDKLPSNIYEQKLMELDELESEMIATLKSNNVPPQKPKNTFQEDEDVVSLELDLRESGLNLDANTQKILQEDNSTGVWLIASGQEYDERAFGVEWEDAKLKEVADRTYQLELISGDAKFSILLHPALIGDDLNNAKSEYAAALNTYERDLAVWENQLGSKTESIKDSILSLKNGIRSEMQAAGFQDQPSEKASIYSVFEVSQFGIWNCDRVLGPKDKRMILDIQDQNGKVYNQHTAYLVDKNQNTLYKFYVGDQALLPISDQEDMELWLVTKDDKIAILKDESWKTKTEETQIPLLQLELQDILFNNAEEVRSVLK